ncbi:MAG: tRNA lysidine(34) synthetase TilS [Cognaticolwellia sp.]
MNIIESTLLNFFDSIAKQPIVIAYSGGVDSQVLLVVLAKLKQQGQLNNPIKVCHVNHGLSPNAKQWQAFAKQQAQHYALPFVSFELNLKKQAQHSLEALARDGRYQALTKASNEPAYIVTGHHLNDQAETFLLALKRGSGVKGLSAMSMSLNLGRHSLVRPLLAISRADIVAYANQQQLTWIEDESNQDLAFDRNFLRQTVVPVLEKRWPSINKAITRSAEHCFEAQQLLEELAQQDLVDCQRSANKLSVSSLNKLSEARVKNLIRYFLSRHNVLMPTSQQLQQIFQQLNAEPDKSPAIQLANGCLRRFKDELYLTAIYQDITLWQHSVDIDSIVDEKPLHVTLPDELGVLSFSTCSEQAKTQIQAQTQIKNNWQAGIEKPSSDQVVTIRFAHQNPKCLPEYRQHSRALKKVLQELAIPPWQRKRLPFLFYNDELVAVIGHFVCQDYLADNQELGLMISWQGDAGFKSCC